MGTGAIRNIPQFLHPNIYRCVCAYVAHTSRKESELSVRNEGYREGVKIIFVELKIKTGISCASTHFHK